MDTTIAYIILIIIILQAISAYKLSPSLSIFYMCCALAFIDFNRDPFKGTIPML